MKPNHKHYLKPKHKHYMQPPITPPAPKSLPSVDEWLSQQAAQADDLQKMYDYVAMLARRRYNSFIAEGFTESQAFELTKLHTTT